MADSSPSTGKNTIPGLPDDWDQRAAEKLLDTVDLVRDKTAGPAIGVARIAVFGILAALLGVIAVILLVVGLVRLLDWIIPFEVWLTYLILGSLFVLIGLFLWSKRPKNTAS